MILLPRPQGCLPVLSPLLAAESVDSSFRAFFQMKQHMDPFRQQLAWDPTQMPCNFDEVTCHSDTGESCAGHPGTAALPAKLSMLCVHNMGPDTGTPKLARRCYDLFQCGQQGSLRPASRQLRHLGVLL